MKTERLFLKSDFDSLPIGVLISAPSKGRPEAVLQLSHGMCGCKERFIPFMEFMASNGVACVANDHRGHVESERSVEDRGYMYEGGSRALVEDMAQLTGWIHHKFPGLPVFLLGHSMGSMAARVYAQTHDRLIDGLIICGSPSWNPLSRFSYAMTGTISFLGAGRYRPVRLSGSMSDIFNRRFADEGPLAWTCSDPAVRHLFHEDPKCNFVFTVNGFHNLMWLMIMTYRHKDWKMANPDMPVIFLSGEDDPCMRSEYSFHEAAKDMYRHGYHNVSSSIYGGMRHEILNEKEKENVWTDILNFIKSNTIR